MPHRRTIKKGSFAGHLDELVEHFAESNGSDKRKPATKAKPKRTTPAKLNQALFERANH